MTNQKQYKSAEGKDAIMNHYNQLMKQWPIPYNEIIVETQYGKTYIIESGDRNKPPILLLHGSSSNSSMWMGDVEMLSKHYHVLAVDIIGEAGKSEENRPDFKNEDFALWLKEVLDALDIQRASFLGNSLGGWMVLKFATAFPQRINKLVLIATSGVTPARVTFLLKVLPYMMKGERGLRGLNKIVYGTDDIPDEVMEVSNLIMRHYNSRVGSPPVFTDEEISRITRPVLFIGGEKDALLPTAKTAKRLKRLLPQTTTRIIKNNSHVVFGIIDEIMMFLRK